MNGCLKVTVHRSSAAAEAGELISPLTCALALCVFKYQCARVTLPLTAKALLWQQILFSVGLDGQVN